MIDKQNFLQASCLLQERLPVAKILTLTVLSALVPTASIVLVSVDQASAQTPTCNSSYSPGTIQQRTKVGLLDSRVGPIKLVNNTATATIISLYHPDAPKRIFKYWYAEPGQSYLLGTDSYSSDWGIQVDEGPICIVGRVATWDGHTFTTFPSRLYIADVPSTAETSLTVDAPMTQGQPMVQSAPLQTPETYEAIATKQIAKGEIRSGLISLLRAADLYRTSGHLKEERRVRDRIQAIRNTDNTSVSNTSKR
ncbi:MAG: hypothetical protein KME45_21085 [Stenomitos rutilans HA7619-LM2]|jgi:hypothetical protein|nr:hypothetical protein [Stenomitos rutilans HA7619-LM2]